MQRDVPVREVMDREFVAASPSDDLGETVELMLREEAGPVLVLEGPELLGAVADRDALAHAVSEGGLDRATVGDAMTDSVPTVAPEQTLDEARDRMAAWSTAWIVVTEGGRPAGVITEHDVLTSSTLGSEADATGARGGPEEGVVAAGADAATAESAVQSAATDGFEDQGICERCESLTRDLTSFNGQLLCADCRDV